MKSFIEIDKKGKVRFFEGDFDLSVKNKKVKRVSKIVPQNLLLRVAFVLIRSLVPDNSKIADWTRTWKCNWIVVLNGKKYGNFKNRKKAIEFERKLYIGELK
ncbi:hypothetical protein [Persephonella sp. KM09-Lau-8]|uniref:hypothetical protein n=1 Tax=Persephonella sp. KM09-Lau-8 TaxID=1158345 RepID=UPI0004974D38|nr:hypothetical protein [Persephonella sp. KM09-Lau-8]